MINHFFTFDITHKYLLLSACFQHPKYDDVESKFFLSHSLNLLRLPALKWLGTNVNARKCRISVKNGGRGKSGKESKGVREVKER